VGALTSITTAVTGRDVEVAGLRIHVDEAGTGEPVVVLHHSTGPFWNPFYDELAGSMHVIGPDMAGYGRSERPVDARSPRDLAILNLQLLDALDLDRVHLVGLGFGGWIAAEMATMAQRRLSTMTLVGPAGIKPRDGFIHDPMMQGWIDYEKACFSSDEAFEEIFGSDPAAEVVQLWDYSREMTARLSWKPWMWTVPLPSLLKGVATPTQVVWGTQDRIVPLDCGEQYVEQLQNAHLEIIEGAGHVIDLERPEVLAQLVVDFAGTGR
jgi:pimeloyl-ACP methyl ester carboxylesterase